MNLDRRIDKATGLEKWWLGDLLVEYPVLKKRGKFLIGKLRIDGALSKWVVDVDEKDFWETDISELKSAYVPRIKALKIVSYLKGHGWIISLYEKSQKDELQKHLEFSKKLLKAKTYSDMLKTISESGIVGDLTPDEIWSNLPKMFIPNLAGLYITAVEKLEA